VSDTDDTLETRVGDLETKQDTMSGKLDQILGILSSGSKTHEAAEQHEEQHLDRPTSVMEQVRAELARAKQEDADEAAAAQEKSELEDLKERVKGLGETRPQSPQPRRERAMWGKR
jgi:archaellum component FlaC